MVTPDYGGVLADLRAKRDEIDGLIRSLERFAGPAVEERIEGVGDVQPDSFFNHSIPDAIRKFLTMSRQPHAAKQIADALETGGLVHESKDFFNTVYTALRREERKGVLVQLPDKRWGLAERYPRAARQQTEQGGKRPAANDEGESGSVDAQAAPTNVKDFPTPGPGSVKGVAFPSEDPGAVPPVFVGGQNGSV